MGKFPTDTRVCVCVCTCVGVVFPLQPCLQIDEITGDTLNTHQWEHELNDHIHGTEYYTAFKKGQAVSRLKWKHVQDWL